jgi:hypothetical protein
MFKKITQDLIDKCNNAKRWEEGIPHHPNSIGLYKLIDYTAFKHFSDAFCFKSGGDGDNGETLMYILDTIFEAQDKANLLPDVYFEIYYLNNKKDGWEESDYDEFDYSLSKTVFVVQDALSFDTERLHGYSDIVMDKENLVIMKKPYGEGPCEKIILKTKDVLGFCMESQDCLQTQVLSWIESISETYSCNLSKAYKEIHEDLFDVLFSICGCTKINKHHL